MLGGVAELGTKNAKAVQEIADLAKNAKKSAAKVEKALDTGTKMLGANGTKTASKTLWKGEGKERIDVENPNPGRRPGQIHYLDKNNNKYLYDPESQSFPGAPNSVNSLLRNESFKNAIDKAMTKYLGE